MSQTHDEGVDEVVISMLHEQQDQDEQQDQEQRQHRQQQELPNISTPPPIASPSSSSDVECFLQQDQQQSPGQDFQTALRKSDGEAGEEEASRATQTITT